MSKKILFLGLFIALGVDCFSQELKVTNTNYNGRVEPIAQWPQDTQVRDQWDQYFTKYTLSRVEANDFDTNDLAKRIGSISTRTTNPKPGDAYTIFLTMGYRKFICFLMGRLDGGTWWWIYEILNE
jgi:hypothetical protein